MARATAAQLQREVTLAGQRVVAAQEDLLRASRYLERMVIARDAAIEHEAKEFTVIERVAMALLCERFKGMSQKDAEEWWRTSTGSLKRNLLDEANRVLGG